MIDFEGKDIIPPPMPHRLKKENYKIQALCIDCGVRFQAANAKSKGGYKPRCWKCSRIKFEPNPNTYGKKRRYKSHKKDRCEECGFTPVHSCQLDVHHLDGDHGNEDPANLKTVCANCHRLIITWRERNSEP